MRTRPLLPTIATSLVLLAACGGNAPVESPASEAKATGEKTEKKEEKGSETKEASSSASGKPEISCKGKMEVGKPAANFSISAVNGGRVSPEKGKVTIVDFWATWCGPCEKSFPKYQELYVKYKASGLEIIGVSVDEDKDKIANFAKSHGAKFPVGWDDGRKIAECYNPPGMPSAYIIDKQGVVRFVHKAFSDGEEKTIEKEIKSLL